MSSNSILTDTNESKTILTPKDPKFTLESNKTAAFVQHLEEI